MQFGLRRVAAFVSSPIHLFGTHFGDRQTNKRMNKWTEPLRKGALSVTTGASITVAIVFAVFFSQENLVHGLPGGTDYWKKLPFAYGLGVSQKNIWICRRISGEIISFSLKSNSK